MTVLSSIGDSTRKASEKHQVLARSTWKMFVSLISTAEFWLQTLNVWSTVMKLGFTPWSFSSWYIKLWKTSSKCYALLNACKFEAVAFVFIVSETEWHYPSVHKSFQALFLLTRLKRSNRICCCCLVAKTCPTLLTVARPGSSVYGISQERIQDWVALSFSKGSSQPRDQTRISCIGNQTLPLSHQGNRIWGNINIHWLFLLIVWFQFLTLKPSIHLECILMWNIRASLVAQMIKNQPAMWETWIWSLG